MALHKTHRGYLMLMAIVFGAIFLTALGGLSTFVLSQNRLQAHSTAQAQALAIAEAGVEYYKWHLAHFPTDTKNGTGSPGPYDISYSDPETGTAGTISLSLTANQSCNQLTSVDISSTGKPAEDPSVTKTVTARYARPSVGTYSYILNDSVWAGADRIINGPYHSNGGVHMDGTANSPVTSSLASWSCDSTYGCTPTQSQAHGVLGSGPNQDLWEYPVPQVNFSGIAADFGTLKTLSQSSGIYYPRYSSGTDSTKVAYWRGYHLVFNGNGTMTVKRVETPTSKTVTPVNPSDGTTDWALISGYASSFTKTGREDNPGETCSGNTCTVPIPSGCGLIFVEDNVWVEGTIPSKITLVAANIANAGVAPNAYLVNNIQYGATDGSDGLTLVAEHDVLVSPSSPAVMTLNGIFIAQDGAFGRNYYGVSPYDPKTSLTILGTTVSNKRTGTKWCLNADCSSSSGYLTRIDSFDRHMASDPPPFTPVVSTDYQLLDWREK